MQGRIPPEQAVAREIRPQREQAGNDRAESEHEGEAARRGDCVSETQAPHARDRDQWGEPAEVGEALELARVAGDEVAERRRVALDLRERPLDGVPQRERPDDHTPGDARARGDRAEPWPPPGERVREHEGDRAESEVHLAGERDRGQRGGGEPRLPALDAVEREREQHRDRAEQVTGRLGDAVRREGEGEPADERGAERQAERTQPERGEAAGADVGQQDEEVPARHRPEERLQRPVDGRERPAGEVHARLDLRLEAVRIEPRLRAPGELMARQPEVVGRLKVVAGRDPPIARRAVAEEVIGLEDGG